MSSGKPSHGGPGVDMKTRIITHMNADHADSLALYLRNYLSVPAYEAASARLDDITVDGITLSYSSPSKTVVLPFEPPLDSLADARPRLVAMSHASSAAVGQALTRVTVYTPPNLMGALNIIGVLFGVVTFALADAMLAPNSPITRFILLGQTGVAGFMREWKGTFLLGIAAIHVTEAGLMWRKAFRHCPRRINALKYEGLGLVGWKWVLSAFAEGATSFQRFNAIIKQQEEKAKH
ncbi:hypothetical protein EXIGLDRAFT_723373 [Exidia glandulosa HHB12029]|uniref:DUF2470 domain-containing protein n=1 Tax=Exidia glandulosa HHB12029 TaxID=1314781 RepID=A0A165EV74_EXIGL|nr:hypothetical protein EXIGLDRAFT_723373 [Exidia glandulosa HHB12029]